MDRHLQGNHAITLPVINIANPSPEIGRQMIDAAAAHGFFYVDTRGTDFTPELVERLFQLSKQFFSSPQAEKAACKIGADNRGWTGMHSETLDPQSQKRGDFKEAFNIGESFNNEIQQPIPKSLRGYESEILDFEARCRSTCHRILRLLALGLEIPDPDWFSSRHRTPSGCTLRLLHYPALVADTDYQPEVDIRAGAHSDYGSITLLFQRPSQPGLEILTNNTTMLDNPITSTNGSQRQQAEEQKWSPVPVIPEGYDPETSSSLQDAQTPLPPILLNIGDLLSYWTNGLLRSTVHRVIFPHESYPSSPPSQNLTTRDDGNIKSPWSRPTDRSPGRLGGDRYSIAYFCHPTDSTALEVVPSRFVPRAVADGVGERRGKGGLRVGYGGGADGGQVLTAKEHLVKRLEATYGFSHQPSA